MELEIPIGILLIHVANRILAGAPPMITVDRDRYLDRVRAAVKKERERLEQVKIPDSKTQTTGMCIIKGPRCAGRVIARGMCKPCYDDWYDGKLEGLPPFKKARRR